MKGEDFACAFVQQAHEWYEVGYRRGHFASVWQRSLYNVPGLRAQPWWTAKETGYTDLVQVLMYMYVCKCVNLYISLNPCHLFILTVCMCLYRRWSGTG